MASHVLQHQTSPIISATLVLYGLMQHSSELTSIDVVLSSQPQHQTFEDVLYYFNCVVGRTQSTIWPANTCTTLVLRPPELTSIDATLPSKLPSQKFEVAERTDLVSSTGLASIGAALAGKLWSWTCGNGRNACGTRFWTSSSSRKSTSCSIFWSRVNRFVFF